MLVIAAEYGDHDQVTDRDYVSKIKLLPKQSLKHEDKVAEMHESLRYAFYRALNFICDVARLKFCVLRRYNSFSCFKSLLETTCVAWTWNEAPTRNEAHLRPKRCNLANF